MKRRLTLRTAPTVAALPAGALLAAAAFAAPITDPDALVQHAVGSEGHVWITVDEEGTATLTGYVDSANTRRLAETAALRGAGVNRVINLVTDN